MAVGPEPVPFFLVYTRPRVPSEHSIERFRTIKKTECALDGADGFRGCQRTRRNPITHATPPHFGSFGPTSELLQNAESDVGEPLDVIGIEWTSEWLQGANARELCHLRFTVSSALGGGEGVSVVVAIASDSFLPRTPPFFRKRKCIWTVEPGKTPICERCKANGLVCEFEVRRKPGPQPRAQPGSSPDVDGDASSPPSVGGDVSDNGGLLSLGTGTSASSILGPAGGQLRPQLSMASTASSADSGFTAQSDVSWLSDPNGVGGNNNTLVLGELSSADLDASFLQMATLDNSGTSLSLPVASAPYLVNASMLTTNTSAPLPAGFLGNSFFGSPGSSSVPSPGSSGPGFSSGPPGARADYGLGFNMENIQLPQPSMSQPAWYTLLPDEVVLNLIVRNYVARMWLMAPHALRPELLMELDTPGIIPDYGLFSLMFWTARFDPQLAEQIGQHRRDNVLKALYERSVQALLPAIELTLAGYDAMVGDDRGFDPATVGSNGGGGYTSAAGQASTSMGAGAPRPRSPREFFARTVVWVLLSLVYMIGVAMAIPAPDETLFRNFRSMVRLAVRVAKMAKISREHLYTLPGLSNSSAIVGTPAPGANNPGGAPQFSPLLERARRAFWGFAIYDNQHAVMHGQDPEIPWENLDESTLSSTVSEGELMYGLQALVRVSTSSTSAESRAAATAFGILTSAWRENVAEAQADRGKPKTPEIFEEPRNPLIFPKFDISRGPITFKMAHLAALVEKYRRRLQQPYLHPSEWKQAVAAVEASFATLLAPFRYGDPLLAVLECVRGVLGTEVGCLATSITFMMLQYHGIICLLCSPSDEVLYSRHLIPDPDWVGSEAFLKAQEHAIRATQLLTPLVNGTGIPPQFCLPVSLFSCLRACWHRSSSFFPLLFPSSSNTASSVPA